MQSPHENSSPPPPPPQPVPPRVPASPHTSPRDVQAQGVSFPPGAIGDPEIPQTNEAPHLQRQERAERHPHTPRHDPSAAGKSRWIVKREYYRVWDTKELIEKDPRELGALVREAEAWRADFNRAKPNIEEWHKKSKKRVLCVLMVWNPDKLGRGRGDYEFFRGLNSEVSLPAGSTCAERSAIVSALAHRPDMKKKEIRAVAVMDPAEPGRSSEPDAPRPPPVKHLNPLPPCGVCGEWLGKIQEENREFVVLTFRRNWEQVLERYPLPFEEEIEVKGIPSRISKQWFCSKCGYSLNPPLAARCRGRDGKCDAMKQGEDNRWEAHASTLRRIWNLRPAPPGEPRPAPRGISKMPDQEAESRVPPQPPFKNNSYVLWSALVDQSAKSNPPMSVEELTRAIASLRSLELVDCVAENGAPYKSGAFEQKEERDASLSSDGDVTVLPVPVSIGREEPMYVHITPLGEDYLDKAGAAERRRQHEERMLQEAEVMFNLVCGEEGSEAADPTVWGGVQAGRPQSWAGS